VHGQVVLETRGVLVVYIALFNQTTSWSKFKVGVARIPLVTTKTWNMDWNRIIMELQQIKNPHMPSHIPAIAGAHVLYA